MGKLSGKVLMEIFEQAFKDSATYKRLDSELSNPGHFMFNGDEYYVYIKNLSPAYFDNPDVWRAQMTAIDTLNVIKESDATFVLLGYDVENRVYATWNPYQVKQRIGTASSPSLYSRYSLQQEVSKTGDIRSMKLNNDLEVLVFPLNSVVDVFSSLNEFFPDTSDYVAMGSKRRKEANAAYKELTNTKKIDVFAKFLIKAGVVPSTVERICQALKHLFNSNLISIHRKIFLAHDSLADYKDAVEEFFNLEDVIEFKNKWDDLFPAIFSSYISFLVEPVFQEFKELNDSLDGAGEDADYLNNDDELEEQSGSVKDWEKDYEDENGNLTKLMNPKLLKQLRPYLDTEYPSLPPCYNIIGDFYGDRYKKMQLKDWGKLLNNIDWANCNEDGIIYNGKNRRKIQSPSTANVRSDKREKIKVHFPDGRIIQPVNVLDALLEVVKYAGAERVHSLNIICCGDNLILNNPLPRYINSSKPVGDGWLCNTCSNTRKKFEQIKEISDKLKLGLKVELV